MNDAFPLSEINDESLKFHRFVINSLPTGVVTVDSGMYVTGVNPWAEQMLGYGLAEAKAPPLRWSYPNRKGLRGRLDGPGPNRLTSDNLKSIIGLREPRQDDRGDHTCKLKINPVF